MKKTLCMLLSLWVACMSYSQYTVTKVIGQVTNKTTGESLRPGSKLRDEDMLAFSSPNDMVRVIVSGKGIYVISPGPKSEKQQSAIVEMLKTALKIKSKEGYLSGRSEEDELMPAVIKADAALNEHVLLATENKYLFNRRMYDVSAGQFFLQTEMPMGKAVIKPLKTVSDTLILYASDIDPAGASYKIGFFFKEKNTSQLLGEIKPTIDSTSDMHTMIDLIMGEHKTTEKEQLRRICYAEVYEALGKPSLIVFNQLFDKLFNEMTKH